MVAVARELVGRESAAAIRDAIVIGGGCYGTFYAGQLVKATGRGRARVRRIVVVDRDPACRARRELGAGVDFVVSDWARYLDGLLSGPGSGPGEPDDFIVPSPHMPHLLFGWVLDRARARWPERTVTASPVPGRLGTPYDRTAADGTRYVSFADWICPTHCVEPAQCPAIGAPRTWEMSEAVTRLVTAQRESAEPVHGLALFVCRHHVFGVGTIPVASLRAGDDVVRAAGAGGEARVLVGTISGCHGALSLVHVGPPPQAPGRRAVLERARDLFNAGSYWEAHEALETVWRSTSEGARALVLQGLIQAAAALLHQSRGNAHGVAVVGRAALEKLAGPQRPDIEFETERFGAALARALAGEGDPPRLEFRRDD